MTNYLSFSEMRNKVVHSGPEKLDAKTIEASTPAVLFFLLVILFVLPSQFAHSQAQAAPKSQMSSDDATSVSVMAKIIEGINFNWSQIYSFECEISETHTNPTVTEAESGKKVIIGTKKKGAFLSITRFKHRTTSRKMVMDHKQMLHEVAEDGSQKDIIIKTNNKFIKFDPSIKTAFITKRERKDARSVPLDLRDFGSPGIDSLIDLLSRVKPFKTKVDKSDAGNFIIVQCDKYENVEPVFTFDINKNCLPIKIEYTSSVLERKSVYTIEYREVIKDTAWFPIKGQMISYNTRRQGRENPSIASESAFLVQQLSHLNEAIDPNSFVFTPPVGTRILDRSSPKPPKSVHKATDGRPLKFIIAFNLIAISFFLLYGLNRIRKGRGSPH